VQTSESFLIRQTKNRAGSGPISRRRSKPQSSSFSSHNRTSKRLHTQSLLTSLLLRATKMRRKNICPRTRCPRYQAARPSPLSPQYQRTSRREAVGPVDSDKSSKDEQDTGMDYAKKLLKATYFLTHRCRQKDIIGELPAERVFST
jgi:hypothetical protein